MKQFDYNKYLKKNPLLKENADQNQISEGGEESQAYEFVSKNYKAMIAPGVEKMLTEFDKKFPKATPEQVAKVTKTILDLAKYQIKVWNQ